MIAFEGCILLRTTDHSVYAVLFLEAEGGSVVISLSDRSTWRLDCSPEFVRRRATP